MELTEEKWCNMHFDGAISSSLFKIPIHPNKKYGIEVKHRPAVPDNLKYWQV